jgi:hypothetical protein
MVILRSFKSFSDVGISIPWGTTGKASTMSSHLFYHRNTKYKLLGEKKLRMPLLLWRSCLLV